MSLLLIEDPRTGSIVVPTYDKGCEVVGYFERERFHCVLSEEKTVRDVRELDALLHKHTHLFAGMLWEIEDAHPLLPLTEFIERGVRFPAAPVRGRPHRFWVNHLDAMNLISDMECVLQFVESGPVIVGTWVEGNAPSEREIHLTLCE